MWVKTTDLTSWRLHCNYIIPKIKANIFNNLAYVRFINVIHLFSLKILLEGIRHLRQQFENISELFWLVGNELNNFNLKRTTRITENQYTIGLLFYISLMFSFKGKLWNSVLVMVTLDRKSMCGKSHSNIYPIRTFFYLSLYREQVGILFRIMS